MRIVNGVADITEGLGSISKTGNYMKFNDADGVTIRLSNKDLFRLVSVIESELTRNGIDVDNYLKNLFKGE